MAKQYYTVPDNPQYHDGDIRRIQNSDPVNADEIVNPVIEALMENTAAVKNQVDGVEAVLPVTGKGAPTPETAGHLGQHYFDADTGTEYVCVAADEKAGVYTWKVSGGIIQQIDGQAPTGSIFWYAKETAPEGYLICDGSAVSRTDYARLFDAIGTTFGVGDGNTTFTLPDLRAKFIRGAGTSSCYAGTFGTTQDATGLVYASGEVWQPSYEGPRNTDATMTAAPTSYIKYEKNDSSSQFIFLFRPYNISLTPIIKY